MQSRVAWTKRKNMFLLYKYVESVTFHLPCAQPSNSFTQAKQNLQKKTTFFKHWNTCSCIPGKLNIYFCTNYLGLTLAATSTYLIEKTTKHSVLYLYYGFLVICTHKRFDYLCWTYMSILLIQGLLWLKFLPFLRWCGVCGDFLFWGPHQLAGLTGQFFRQFFGWFCGCRFLQKQNNNDGDLTPSWKYYTSTNRTYVMHRIYWNRNHQPYSFDLVYFDEISWPIIQTDCNSLAGQAFMFLSCPMKRPTFSLRSADISPCVSLGWGSASHGWKKPRSSASKEHLIFSRLRF